MKVFDVDAAERTKRQFHFVYIEFIEFSACDATVSHMPFGYHLNQDDGLVTITGNDKVSLAEAIALGRKLLRDPVFDPALPHLVDLRGMELAGNAEDSHHLREFVLQDYRPSVQASIAVVIDHTLDQQSVAGLYHLSCAMDQTELFDHYDHALRWLMRREFAPGAARG